MCLAVPATTPAAAQAPTAQATDQWFVNDGVWLRYRLFGSGAPLVMINTNSATNDALLPLARALGTTRRVILLDARGFGTSGRPVDAEQYGAAFVDDVLLLFDALKLRSADVVGHATGAVIAARLAARSPERVRRLVLVGGPVYRDAARMQQQLAPTVTALAATLPKRDTPKSRAGEYVVLTTRAAIPARRPAPDTAGPKAEPSAVAERRALVAALQSLPSIAVSERDVARLRMPVLAAAGGRDAFVDAMRELSAWWPNAQSFVVDGATRDGVLSDAKFVARVRDFLR